MDRKVIWIGLGILSFVILAAVTTAMLAQPPEFHATVYEPKAAPQIVLPKADGQEFRLSDYHGKVVLLFFGYTNCPDVCPTTMAKLKQAVEQLGPHAQQVQVVFITVDPQRDTLQAAQKYASAFDPSFLGLSGSENELMPVWDSYGAYRELGPKDANGNYPITHTARVTAIDGKGNLRLSFNYDIPWQQIFEDLQLLLDEG